MPLATPNPSPRSLPIIVEHAGPWKIVDVGARGGISPVWEPMKPYAHFECFDPDPAECERLKEPGMSFTPAALDAVPGARTLHLTRSPWCHGFVPINPDARRFPNWVNNEPVSSIPVPTTTLDRALQDRADFVKIDTEGSELDVLRGGERTLEHCLGVMVELWFGTKDALPPWMIDCHLRRAGFRFYDIAVQRYPRNTMPVGHLRDDGSAPPQFRDHGQVMTGDALYFRDPIASPDRARGWSTDELLHLIGLLDLWGYQDAALELAFHDRAWLASVLDVDALIASLVPPIGGRIVSFDDYWRRSAAQFGSSHLADGVVPKLVMPQ